MARLTKRDVEELLASYDADARTALTAALARVLDLPNASWAQLLDAAPFTETRRAALAAGDQRELDRLAAELNEMRTLVPPDSPNNRH